MPVTWTVQLTVTNLAERRVRLTATRTDTDQTPEEVRTYTADGIYDTVNKTPQELLLEYTDLFWAKYEADVAAEINHADLIIGAENALANALDAKEAE